MDTKEIFPETKAYTSFKGLGGMPVTMEKIEEELAKWPLDGLLGFLAIVSSDAINKGQDFFDPRQQAGYMNQAIVDDFPASLPYVSNMYAPGRVPHTGGRHLFIHELNLARLAHLAILHATEGSRTETICYDLTRRVCRLLLIINDLSPGERVKTETILRSLVERRNLALEWLRYNQFNRFFNRRHVTMAKLARQQILLLDILPKFFKGTETAFQDATNGVSLRRYFEILALILSHVYEGIKPGKQWFQKQVINSKLKGGVREVDLIFQRWTRTPDEYRERFSNWSSSCPLSGLEWFDFVPLRETPLIEARPDEFVAPVLPFLLAKIEDDPYFILSDYLGNRRDFQKAIGLAYEQYAAGLVERISRGDSGGAWAYEHSPVIKTNNQLADDYLQRREIGICFEHKGGRPGTEYLRGGKGDRLLGPVESVLVRLDQKEVISFKEGVNLDEGILTRGMWQQCIHGVDLVSWAEGKNGERPSVLWPIITTLTNLQIDNVVYLVYITPLIEAAQLYKDNYWQKPQWIQIADLEALASLSEKGKLNLSALLQKKSQLHKNKRFDVFLYEQFDGKDTIDKNLLDKFGKLCEDAMVTFFEELLEPINAF
ncbi:MAG: hypothetical protein Q8K00_20705 [Syntrophales bacterium]|nr:hypothetical protein [Syntrophales bacterium]